MFFVQACRGAGYMDPWKIEDRRSGRLVDYSEADGRTVKKQHEYPCGWPVDADILIHYAQSEGYTSTRNPYAGSTFIVGLVSFVQDLR